MNPIRAMDQEAGLGEVRRPLIPRHTISQAQVQLSADRPVRTQTLSVAGNVNPHQHDYYEICVAHSGDGVHETDHYALPLTPGAVVVIAPGQTHGFSAVKNLRVTNIYYLAEWLLSDLRALWEHDGLVPLFLAASLFRRSMNEIRVPQFEMTRKESAECARELGDIAQELSTPKPSLVFLKSSLLKFLVRLSRTYARTHQSQERALGFEFRREVWTALNSIEESIRQSTPISVDAIADETRLSADHLSRVFKEATGWAPMDYFQRRRIHHACTWLLNPRNSVTDVAVALGFSDAAHFSRLFSRYQGVSPREYRKMYLPE